jgi:hypothetical protein
MPLLFSYGPLQGEHVQLTLFGRVLVARKNFLLGFEQTLLRVEDADFARTSGKTRHAILRPARDAQARIFATALEITEHELEVTDKYEPVEYRRVIASLASGRRAWVYVDASSASRETSRQ